MARQPTDVLNEAKVLLDVRACCSSETVISEIENWVRQLLRPLADNGDAHASYLLGGLENELHSGESFDDFVLNQFLTGADANIPEAMFYLAHWYWENGQKAKALPLYKKAAEAGHAYAMWCYGLDLMSGSGGEEDQQEGLRQIEKAAHLKFEGAIQFMANAYASGQYGFTKDDRRAAEWFREMGSPDLIRF